MNERRFEHAANPGFRCREGMVLLPFGRASFLRAAIEAADGREIEMDETTDRRVFDLRRPAAPVTLVYCGMGAPAAVNALEMAAANGARRVVLFGACGGAAPEVGIGDLVAVSGAVRGEGSSRYYAPPGFPALFDPPLVCALERAAAARAAAVHRGVVFTTDASYRQGDEIYRDCEGLVLAVESEAAAAAVAASRLRLAAGALLFCTDNVMAEAGSDRPYRGLSDERVRRGFDAALGAVLDVLGGGGGGAV